MMSFMDACSTTKNNLQGLHTMTKEIALKKAHLLYNEKKCVVCCKLGQIHLNFEISNS